MAVPEVKLNSGAMIPAIGLGLWKVHLPWEVHDAVSGGLAAGFRHFDDAQAYLNEQFLGQEIVKAGTPREELFITTKIFTGNMKLGRVQASFEGSLKRLKTDYVDLLLLHFPVTGKRQAAWKDLEEIHGSGRAKSIGVSNYTVRHLEELLADCKVRPAVNQVELHVFLQQPELIEYCHQQDIVVEAYSPLAHGQGMDNPVLNEIAKKHGKSSAQIMLRWCVDKGLVPLPKSTHAERIKSNIDIFDFKLDAGDMEKLKQLDSNRRTCWDPTDVE